MSSYSTKYILHMWKSVFVLEILMIRSRKEMRALHAGEAAG